MIQEILRPLDRSDRRRTAIEVYDTLQALILSGQLKPGTIVSQVQIAKALDVSRTPVREAMRMLQEGGLLCGEPNYRSRVVGFDPADIEALYVKRITLETIGVAMTTRRMTPEILQEIRSVIEALESDVAHQDFAHWQLLHREFHRLIVKDAGEVFAGDFEYLHRRSERYLSAYKGAHMPGWWHRGEQEHRELFAAIAARNVARSAELSARHLARTALELLAALAPEYDTFRLRTSMRFAIDGAASL